MFTGRLVSLPGGGSHVGWGFLLSGFGSGCPGPPRSARAGARGPLWLNGEMSRDPARERTASRDKRIGNISGTIGQGRCCCRLRKIGPSRVDFGPERRGKCHARPVRRVPCRAGPGQGARIASPAPCRVTICGRASRESHSLRVAIRSKRAASRTLERVAIRSERAASRTLRVAIRSRASRESQRCESRSAASESRVARCESRSASEPRVARRGSRSAAPTSPERFGAAEVRPPGQPPSRCAPTSPERPAPRAGPSAKEGT